MRNTNGINRLGIVLNKQMNKNSDKPLVLDFGVIQDDYSLLTNTYPLPIPLSDYVICRSVSYDPKKPLTMTWWADEEPSVSGWEDEDWSENAWRGSKVNNHNPPDTSPPHGHGNKGESDIECGKHYHDVYLPKKMRWLVPGDRVLVAWVGVDAVVIDIVMDAKEAIKS